MMGLPIVCTAAVTGLGMTRDDGGEKRKTLFETNRTIQGPLAPQDHGPFALVHRPPLIWGRWGNSLRREAPMLLSPASSPKRIRWELGDIIWGLGSSPRGTCLKHLPRARPKPSQLEQKSIGSTLSPSQLSELLILSEKTNFIHLHSQSCSFGH